MPVATAGLTCNRLSLLEALTAVSSVVPTRSPRAILQSVLLHATPDGTTLAATDLEVGCRHRVLGVQCDSPARLVLPPARLKSILQTADDEVVYLATEDDKFVIRGRRFRFTLSLEDPDLFPAVPEFTAADYHELTGADLKRLIGRTSYAVDVTSTRYALGGCLVHPADDTMAFVATDGRRLSKQVVPASRVGEGIPSGKTVVVPAKALKLIARVVEDDDVVAIALGDNAALVRTDNATIYSRLVEGRFPAYEAVFPASASSVVTVDAGSLLDGCEQAAIMTSDESRGVDFLWDGDTLKLTSQAADVGSGRTELAIVTLSGEPVTLTLDPRYAIETLRSIDRDAVVRVELVDDKSPLVFRTEDGLVSVCMPLTKSR